MNMQTKLKFSKVLQQALEENCVSLPYDIEYTYENITAYRALTIIKGQPALITKEAFASQMELKEMYPDKRYLQDCDETDIENYSCSLFTDKNALINAMHLPRPAKAVMRGSVRYQNGAVNRNKITKHINWWLYEDHTAIEDFEVIDYDEQ